MVMTHVDLIEKLLKYVDAVGKLNEDMLTLDTPGTPPTAATTRRSRCRHATRSSAEDSGFRVCDMHIRAFKRVAMRFREVYGPLNHVYFSRELRFVWLARRRQRLIWVADE